MSVSDTAPPASGGHLRDFLRLLLWRRPLSAAPLSARAILAIFAALFVAELGVDLFEADFNVGRFNPYALPATLAATLAPLVPMILFAHVDRSRTTLRNLILAFMAMMLIGAAEHMALHVYGRARLKALPTIAQWGTSAAGALVYVWLIGLFRQAFRPAPQVRRPGLRAVALIISIVLAVMAAPYWPTFGGRDAYQKQANLWTYYYYWAHRNDAAEAAKSRAAAREAEAEAARLEAAQPRMLAEALDKLAPRDPLKPNLYVLAVAGFAQQDVFRREIAQATDILKARYDIGAHVLTLINNSATARDAPMASMANIAAALAGLGARMDPDKDALMLVMSSHGSPDGFALAYDNYFDRTLDPQTLRLALDAAHIRNRIAIVSSCYAGAFVAPLSDPDTMVLTAASSRRASFGCSDDRDWTWFGEALFGKGLAQRRPLAEAFAIARTTIAGWERDRKMTPSEPQIFIGERLAQRFPDWVGAAPKLAAAAPTR